VPLQNQSTDPTPLLDAFTSDTPLGEFLRYFSRRLRAESIEAKNGQLTESPEGQHT